MQTAIKVLSKKENGLSILDSILNSRGIKNREEYFNPAEKELLSPYSFSDMKKAVEIIKNAIENRDKILVWGDFDADGVTSTSILFKALKALDANFDYFLPDRQKLGHGLNLKELLTQKSKGNIKVLITVDCGISSAKEIELIKTMGVKTIITDHHEPPEILPAADCILNPLAKNSLDESLSVSDIEKISYLSGAGVAMELAYALLGDEFQTVKDEIIALASVGTISDVVPLAGENRIIAAKGLVQINKGVHKGIKKLFEKQNFTKEITSEDVAFILAPRINSAGRLDSPFESIKLLIEDNPLVIDMAIEKLDALNKIRQNLCEKAFEEALSMLRAPSGCIVLFNKDWHIGIIGIVASKLVERFNLPVFLMTTDEKEIFRCSIRGTSAYDISKLLKSLSDCFLGYGGHSLAGGFSADSNLISFETLKKRIETAADECRDDSKENNALEIDIELDGDDVNFELIEEIKKMEPFGACNKKPVFLFKNACVSSWKTIGKESNHLSYSVIKDSREFSCLYWKRKILGAPAGDLIDIVFRPEVNSFNGEDKIQLITECILNDKLETSYIKGMKIFDHRQKTGILDKIDDYVKNKNGEVKIWASSIPVKKEIEKFIHIKENIITDPLCRQKTLMLFDYPPTSAMFEELIKTIKPDNLHIMRNIFSKNPDDYISLICGMIKYASNNKNGNIDIGLLALNSGLDEVCVQILLEILEKIESVRIDDVDKITFLKAPHLDKIHTDSMFEIFKDEFNRVMDFKEYLQNASIDSIEELCGN